MAHVRIQVQFLADLDVQRRHAAANSGVEATCEARGVHRQLRLESPDGVATTMVVSPFAIAHNRATKTKRRSFSDRARCTRSNGCVWGSSIGGAGKAISSTQWNHTFEADLIPGDGVHHLLGHGSDVPGRARHAAQVERLPLDWGTCKKHSSRPIQHIRTEPEFARV